MKKILTLIAALALLTSARADSLAYSVTSGVSSNLLAVGQILDNITVTATTTNITTFRFYDTSNTTTSIVRAAYSNVISYSTNYSTVFTNEAGLLITNSFAGRWTGPATVSAVTNSRPALLTVVVPAGTTRSRDVRIITLHGLAVVPNADGIVEVTYR